MLTDGFSKVTPLADAYLLDEKTIHVYSKHALIQAIGYLKYILAKEHHMGMAMRGQRKLYGSLTPSLFHSIKNKSAAVNAKTELQNLLQRAKDNYTRYNDLLDESKQMAKRLLEKDSYIEELKKCKNKSDVVQLDIKLSGEKEQFDCFCDNLRHALWDVPPIVRTAFYYSNKGETLPLPVYGEEDKWTDIREACDQKFIEYEPGESVVLNDEHPIVKKIQKSLTELSSFISDCSPEFYDNFTQKHDFLLNLEDKNFWDNFLS